MNKETANIVITNCKNCTELAMETSGDKYTFEFERGSIRITPIESNNFSGMSITKWVEIAEKHDPLAGFIVTIYRGKLQVLIF